MKPPCLSGLAGFLLLLPAAACGQTGQQPERGSTPVSRPRAGLTLLDFTARQERRTLSADTDGDGKVSKAEYLAAARSGKGDPSRRFARIDRDGDGMIDRREMDGMAARRFGLLDTNRDGMLTPAERATARAAKNRGDAAPEPDDG